MACSFISNDSCHKQKFKINLEGQNNVHVYVILPRNVKIFCIMASL